MSSSVPTVSFTQLGLTSSEQQILRQHIQLASQRHGSGGGSVSRGRGTVISSAPSSRAASAASSQNRLLVDPGSLRHLQQHFDAVMTSIQRRIDVLEEHSSAAVQAAQAMAARSEAAADREIRRYREINSEMDRLDRDMDTIIRIQKVVRTVADRVREMSQRLDRGRR